MMADMRCRTSRDDNLNRAISLSPLCVAWWAAADLSRWARSVPADGDSIPQLVAGGGTALLLLAAVRLCYRLA
jgi:hypothetical protein